MREANSENGVMAGRRFSAESLAVAILSAVLALAVTTLGLSQSIGGRCSPCRAWATDRSLAALEGSAPSLLTTTSVDGSLSVDASSADAVSAMEEPVEPALAVRAVEEFLQYPAGLPAGCEPVSLALALRSLGFEVTVEELLADYVNYDGTWTDAGSYMGSPYESGGAFPPAMMAAANAYLTAQGADMQAVDASGSSFEELAELAAEGSPVLLWTTMYGDEPVFTGQNIDGYEWYRNEHCVLLYGAEGDEVLVSDPLEGLVTRDAAEFGRLYEECGSFAVCFAV